MRIFKDFSTLFHIWKWLYRRQGLLIRFLVCWALTTALLTNDEIDNYDTRFQIRGRQTVSSDIILLNVKPSDLSRYYDARTQSLLNLNQNQDFSESFFWEVELWHQIISRVLEQNPKRIGVTVFWSSESVQKKISPAQAQAFSDQRISWATQIGPFEQPIPPLLARHDLSNVGLVDMERDEDGVVRKVLTHWSETQHMAERLANREFTTLNPSQLINFSGPQNTFSQLTVGELLSGDLPEDYLKNKIVIIGASHVTGQRYLTPLGSMTRSEIIAQITDNLILENWIKRPPLILIIFYALFITVVAVLIITQYPQVVALFFLAWLGLLSVSTSIYSFDVISIWLPAAGVVTSLLVIWFIFVGYQASRIERRNFMLEQEQKYLQELEQLKNNFVSLISHDLKTPLAKIQGVIDRLKSRPDSLLGTDLEALEISATELNRYIQSILKVMRVESRDFQLNLQSTDLNELVEDALDSLVPLARDKQLKIDKNLEPLFLVDLDATLIREVVQNLIENAIKYSPLGGQINVQSFETETEVGFLVSDSGEGIPPEEHSRVWGKFVRGQGQSHKTKGTGLGLYLVKYFVELHGGRVTLQSQLGQGTQVGFYLPL
jgi:two-component system phosphate regulon sensor histidine kinase PhoR